MTRQSLHRTFFVAHPGSELYGSDRVMLESVSALVEAGARVVVLLISSGPLVREIEARGGSVRYLATPVLRKSMLTPRGILQLVRLSVTGLRAGRKLVRELRPSAIYVSTLTVPLWIAIGRINRIPVLCHVHEAEGSANPLLRKALAAPLSFANRIVANSRFSVAVLERSNTRAGCRAQVVYNSVPGPDTATLGDERPGLRVVYIGRLSPRKGVDVAVDAVGELQRRGVDATLSIVGDVFPGYEWYREELRGRAATQGLVGQVEFHGFQPEVWPYLISADVVVVPSRVDEPFGNTAVEAILAARPLIVSDTSGLREAAAGYSSAQYVTAGNVGDIALALERYS